MLPSIETRDWYTTPELVQQAQVTRASIYQWLAKGWLVGYRMGGQHRIPKLEWQRFLERGKKK
jgi:excisionase family DNA binding protein